MTALLEIFGMLLGLALVMATVVDSKREPLVDTLRIAFGGAVALGMVAGLAVTVTA